MCRPVARGAYDDEFRFCDMELVTTVPTHQPEAARAWHTLLFGDPLASCFVQARPSRLAVWMYVCD